MTTATTTTTVVLVNSLNSRRRRAEGWTVHADGCTDLAKELRDGGFAEDRGTLEKVKANYDLGYGPEGGFEDPWVFDRDVKVYPCVKRG